MLNKYEQADNLGRGIVISLFSDKVTLVEGQPEDRYDLSGSTLNGDFYIEVKYRPDLKSTAYDTDLLEYEKMCGLRNIDRNGNHFYFMLFSDGIGRLYNLKDISIIDVYINNKLCPVSSVEDRGFKDKLVIELPTIKARIFKWN